MTVEIYKDGKLLTQGSVSLSLWYGDPVSGCHNGRCQTRTDQWRDISGHRSGNRQERECDCRRHYCHDNGCRDKNDHENILIGYPIFFQTRFDIVAIVSIKRANSVIRFVR